MKQQSIDLRNEFQSIPAEEPFFDEETVQTIPAVVPLEETPTRTSARRFKKLRVPMRKTDNSFNPAFLIMALVAVTALGVIAGTLVYRAASENRANNAVLETDEPVNRTIPAQYQFVVDKPETGETKNNSPKDNLPSDNLSTLPAASAPEKRDSRENAESSAPESENEEQPAQNEEAAEEKPSEITSDEIEEPPPPPPMRRDRNKKQDKAKQKNDSPKPETQEEEPPSDESNESSSSSSIEN